MEEKLLNIILINNNTYNHSSNDIQFEKLKFLSVFTI